MRTLIINNKGDVEVDPFDRKGEYERWLASITTVDGLDYCSIGKISAFHSEMITKYVLDLASGKNMAKGHKKGPRSYVHLVHARHRLAGLFRLLEGQTGKHNMDFSEDEVLAVFNGMRRGSILTLKGKSFLDVASYAKNFCAFWR